MFDESKEMIVKLSAVNYRSYQQMGHRAFFDTQISQDIQRTSDFFDKLVYVIAPTQEKLAFFIPSRYCK